MVSIYDFLYVDKSRIFSIYAQVFGGLVLYTKKRYGYVQDADKSAAIDIKIAKADIGHKEVNIDELIHTISPHEIITIDVISKLLDLSGDKNSKVVLLNGDLIFMDEFLIEMAGQFFDIMESIMDDDIAKLLSKKDRKKMKKFNQMLKDFVAKTPMLPAFILQCESEIWGGTLKKDMLPEPISSFYLKYGNQQIANVYVLGIKEESQQSEPFSENLTQAMATLLPEFRKLVFPEGTKTVTPLAIFRKIGEVDNKRTDV